MNKSSFILSTILLSSINIIIRSLGFIYKIFLSKLIGATGIGLYQMVFPFLMLMISISTAGIPVGVSKLVAKEKSLHNEDGVYKTLLIALSIGGIISLSLSIFVSLKINYIVNNILKNPILYYPVLWTIPAISLITFSSILRGFFYGIKEMSTPAISQIIEQICRIGFALLLLYYKKPSNSILAATIAIIGISIGEFFGLVFLFLKFSFSNKNTSFVILKNSRYNCVNIFKDLLYISFPITLNNIISVTMQTLNSILIPQRLQLSGYSAISAIEVFGKISGMAMSLLFLPFTVTNALVVNIIPNISEALALKDWKELNSKSNLALKITLLISIPISIAYTVFGKHISMLIYGQEDIGRYLSILSYGTVFQCLQHTSSGILQGLGKQVIVTINSFLGAILQLYCIYFLMANPIYGINGYFIGFLLSVLLVFILNFIILFRYISLNLSFIYYIFSPIFASIIMVLSMIYSYKTAFYIINHNLWSSIIATFTGFILYIILLFLTKTLDLKHIKNTFK
ncbi:MAG: polysaccharide biosynthesis protein [Clostridiales bacterium]|nr:polysaccharide biosynthesis protein [Clostridiales bacterium]